MKKLLALVLALVMTLGLATVGANAYGDDAEVSYKEAVDVMSYVGVFQGNENGDFLPKAELDRASAAKLIAYLTVGEDVEGLTATQKFDDVPATHWAAKYVMYCSNVGYIAGAGDGNFYPASKLTGYAFAKMLLCALGFDAKLEGFEGEGWELKVAKKVQQLNLNAGVDKALSAVLTREEAAQFCLNALQQKMWEYENTGTTITIGDTVISTGAGAAQLVVPNITLAKSLYNADITTAAGTDDFGRPATTWKLGTKTIASYADEATLTYTTAVTGGKLYTALGKVSPATVTVKVDGVAAAAPTIQSGNSNTSVGGTGALTQVYYNADTDVANITVINTYIGKITAWTAAQKNADGEIIAKEKVTVKTLGNEAVGEFETTDFAKADATNQTYVLYTKAGAALQSVDAVDPVEAVKVTSTSATKVNSYLKAAKYDAASAVYTLGNKYDLYLDTYGNVIYGEAHADAATENTNYVYVLDLGYEISVGNGFTNDLVYKNAKVIDTTGAISVIKVLATYPNVGGWYTFAEDDDNADYYKGTAVESVAANANGLKKSTPTIVAGLVANNSTIFVLKTAANTYKVYNGLSSLPTYTGNVPVNGIVKNNYAAVVFADVTGAESGTSTTAPEAVFVLGRRDESEVLYDEATETSYVVFKAIINGAETTFNAVAANAGNVHTGLQKLTKNNKGFVTSSSDYDANLYTKTYLVDGAIAYVEGTLTVTGCEPCVVENITAFIYEDGELTETNVAGLAGTGLTGALYAMKTSATNATPTVFYYMAGEVEP